MTDVRCEIWLLHRVRTVLVSEAGIGVPEPAIRSTDGTVGGTTFSRKDLLPGECSVKAALTRAHYEAEYRGYRVETCVPSLGLQTTEMSYVIPREVLPHLPGHPELVR